MASASFVEIISHFAGYLQIFHDIARDRLHYDETLTPRDGKTPATTTHRNFLARWKRAASGYTLDHLVATPMPPGITGAK